MRSINFLLTFLCPLLNPIGFPSLYRLLSLRIWAILVTSLNVVGPRCAPVTALLPLLVSRGQNARGCGNGMDNGLFLPHCIAMARIRTEFFPHPQLISPDLHQSQERPLANVGWICPPQSTPWRRPWPLSSLAQ